MRQFFNTECVVYRVTKTLGQYNRPVEHEERINKYPCKFQKKSVSSYQGKAQGLTDEVYTLFLYPNADVKAGDIVEVQGRKFIAAIPIPYRTYLTFDVRLKGEL